MFEYDEEIVQSLLRDNEAFKSLYERHDELKEQVHDAEVGTKPVDDMTLGAMKKEKLHTKDRMAELIEEYRKELRVHH